MLSAAEVDAPAGAEVMGVPTVDGVASRELSARGFVYEGYDAALMRHRWTSQVTSLVNVDICFYPHGDFSGRVWTAAKTYTEFGEPAVAGLTREIPARDLGRTLLRLIAEAYLSLLCGDCGLPFTKPVPNYRPRESEHAVCDDCVRLYRNCVVCGEETRDRVCVVCSYACFVKSNFPDNLTPARCVWFTIVNRFSVFDAPGSVTRIAKLSGTNVPTAKRVVARAGDMLEWVTGSDGVTRYRLQLPRSMQTG